MDEVLRLVELDGAAHRRVKGYSLGMRQRLGLAAALLGDPELLILDEPANGLDPEGVRWLRDFLRAFAAGKKTVLISSHVLAEVAQTVDQVLIINRGKLVVESSLEQLTARVGGSVRVRTPERSKLQEALLRERIETTTVDEQGLLVHGVSSEKVGDLAFAAGVPIHELVAEGSSLEDIFLELTAEPQTVIAQAQGRAAEDPHDPHHHRDRARDDRADPALLTALGPANEGAEPHEHRGSTRAAERRQPRRRLLGARGDHARDQRVPPSARSAPPSSSPPDARA